MPNILKHTLRKMYKKGSLFNVDLNDDGRPDAFQFTFKNPHHMVCFYATYELELFLNEERINKEDITIVTKDKNYLAKDLVKSHLVSHEGDEITIQVRRKGGLEVGKEYFIRLSQLASGFFYEKGGKIPLVDFSDVVKEK